MLILLQDYIYYKTRFRGSKPTWEWMPIKGFETEYAENGDAEGFGLKMDSGPYYVVMRTEYWEKFKDRT